jgi:endoglucanase
MLDPSSSIGCDSTHLRMKYFKQGIIESASIHSIDASLRSKITLSIVTYALPELSRFSGRGLWLLLGALVLPACSAADGSSEPSVPAFGGYVPPGSGAPGNPASPGTVPGAGVVPVSPGGAANGEGNPSQAPLTGNGAPVGQGGVVDQGGPVVGEPVPNLLPPAPPVLTRGQGAPLVQNSQELTRLAYGFYGAQRSGDGANWLLDAGEQCHMNDGQAIGQELSGGWYDAGDHLKVTLSIAYGAYVVSKAYDAFPSAFGDADGPRYTGSANGVPDVLDEVRYAADYIVKAHIATDQLVAMVGEINSDHGLPLRNGRCSSAQAQSIARPVSMDSNADVAGIASAALALAARLYQSFDPTLASTYLSHARDVYDIAKANPRGSSPGLYSQVEYELGWVDEALCGATEMYRATGEQQYLDDALVFDEMLGPHQWAPNFSQSADFCRHSLIVGLRDAGNLDAAQRVALNLKTDIDNYVAKISTEPNTVGMMHMDEWGSLRYASGASFGASLYYEVTGDASARDLALSQLNYIMGENSYNRSFVVGFGNNPPSNPHHRNQIATGRSLAGALVGGPTNGGGYTDNADDYVANEVALDYNAGLVGLAAFGAVESGN